MIVFLLSNSAFFQGYEMWWIQDGYQIQIKGVDNFLVYFKAQIVEGRVLDCL